MFNSKGICVTAEYNRPYQLQAGESSLPDLIHSSEQKSTGTFVYLLRVRQMEVRKTIALIVCFVLQ